MPIKIPMSFFREIEKSILKFIRKHKRPQIAKVNLGNQSNALFKLQNFKLYYRAIIKTAWYYNEMFNIFSHKGNANQTCTKIPSLWRAEYISTAVSNILQAAFGMAPASEEGKMQHSCFS
jgi:hypothetical protein